MIPMFRILGTGLTKARIGKKPDRKREFFAAIDKETKGELVKVLNYLITKLRSIALRLQKTRLIGWVLAASMLSATGGGATVAAQSVFPLHTAGRFIVDSNGHRVFLNGVNWYGAESTDFVVAGLQVATLQSIVQQIKSLGFNVVRLPWSNQLYESNPVVGSYALAANPSLEGENALTILDQVIGALTTAGIMVILDNHNSNAEWCCSTTDGNSLWYNSQYPQANWITDWQGMVQRYQNNPLVIGADLRNEPRSPATWGGSSADDWHAAAELGGNAVLSVNPNLLVFVEGVNYALDLSGVASLPVQLNVADQLVYEAHDYSFDYSGLTSYGDYTSQISSRWGYLVTGSNPQPLWIGEFGTCNTAGNCVDSDSNGDGGYWFNMVTAFIQEYGIDWTYWAVNGTESTGNGRTYGAAETYGILNATWNGSANSGLTARLEGMMANAPANLSLVGNGVAMTISPGSTATATMAVVPGNGFSGTVNLMCTVSPLPGGIDAPTCSVPASVNVSGNLPATVTISVMTTGAARDSSPNDPMTRRRMPAGVAVACGVLLIGSFARRGRSTLVSILVLAIVFGLTGFSGCGGGVAANSGNGAEPTETTAGSYTVEVTASANGVNAANGQIAVEVQ
jgi:endoglucanase